MLAAGVVADADATAAAVVLCTRDCGAGSLTEGVDWASYPAAEGEGSSAAVGLTGADGGAFKLETGIRATEVTEVGGRVDAAVERGVFDALCATIVAEAI